MRREFTLVRLLAWLYTAFISLLIAWAWYVDIKWFHSEREHLLPDFLLFFAALPLSFSVSLVYDLWTEIFRNPFAQLAWVTACAIGQVIALFWLANWFERRTRDA